MTRTLIPVIVLCLAAGAFAQAIPAPKVGGYLFFDYSTGQADSPFSIGRIGGLGAGLFLSGQLSDQFGYNLEVRYGDESRVEIDQAWLSFNASQSIRVNLGEFLVPFGKYNQASRPHETLLVNTPLVFEFAYPLRWREIGLQGQANWSWLNVTAYIGNGLAEAASVSEGQQFDDNNANKAWGGRLGLQPDKTIDLGVSYYRGKYDNLGQRSLWLLGADAAWVTQEYQILAEYIKTQNDNPAPFAKGVVEGFYVQMAINYQNFFPVVSFQKVKETDPFHGAGWAPPDTPGAGLSVNRTRWAAGLVYQPVTSIHLKLEYDFNKDQGLTLKENVLSIQAAVSF
jgi:opacity protein-like surface antigen